MIAIVNCVQRYRICRCSLLQRANADEIVNCEVKREAPASFVLRHVVTVALMQHWRGDRALHRSKKN